MWREPTAFEPPCQGVVAGWSQVDSAQDHASARDWSCMVPRKVVATSTFTMRPPVRFEDPTTAVAPPSPERVRNAFGW